MYASIWMVFLFSFAAHTTKCSLVLVVSNYPSNLDFYFIKYPLSTLVFYQQ